MVHSVRTFSLTSWRRRSTSGLPAPARAWLFCSTASRGDDTVTGARNRRPRTYRLGMVVGCRRRARRRIAAVHWDGRHGVIAGAVAGAAAVRAVAVDRFQARVATPPIKAGRRASIELDVRVASRATIGRRRPMACCRRRRRRGRSRRRVPTGSWCPAPDHTRRSIRSQCVHQRGRQRKGPDRGEQSRPTSCVSMWPGGKSRLGA